MFGLRNYDIGNIFNVFFFFIFEVLKVDFYYGFFLLNGLW